MQYFMVVLHGESLLNKTDVVCTHLGVLFPFSVIYEWYNTADCVCTFW